MFDKLPHDVIVVILSFLEFEELFTFAIVCKLSSVLGGKAIDFLFREFDNIYNLRIKQVETTKRIMCASNGICNYSSFSEFRYLKERFNMEGGNSTVMFPAVFIDYTGFFVNNDFPRLRGDYLDLDFHGRYYFKHLYTISDESFSDNEEDMLNIFYNEKRWTLDHTPSLSFCAKFIKSHRDFGKTKFVLSRSACYTVPKRMLLCKLFSHVKLFKLIEPFFSKAFYRCTSICFNTKEEMFELRDYFYEHSGIQISNVCEILGQNVADLIEGLHKHSCTKNNEEIFITNDLDAVYDEHRIITVYRINLHAIFYCLGYTEKPPKKFLAPSEAFCETYRERYLDMIERIARA